MTEATRVPIGKVDGVRDAAAAVSGFLGFQELLAGGGIPLPADVDPNLGRVLAYETLGGRIAGCTGCSLAQHRSRVVFSGGNPQARICLVGEAPGAEEDAVGEPFVGEAGHLLDKILKSIELSRRDVCMVNIIKCRPPDNRDPLPEEITTCSPILELQLALLQPAIIFSLGRIATRYLLGVDAPLRALRGRWHRRGNADLIATYHPAALLRNDSLKKFVWHDVKKLRARYGRMST